MKILLYTIILMIVILLFFLLKSMKKGLLITLITSTIIIYFIINPTICMNASIKGANLFFNSVFPALFPFVVMTSILINYNGINIYSKILGPIICKPLGLPKESSFALIVSALCGYPLGAKYSSDLYENKIISLSQFSKLINVASNASPLFIIGAIGTSMLNNTKSGYIILISNYLSCIVMAFLIKSDNYSSFKSITTSSNKNFGTILKEAVDSALSTSLSVASFIVIFSVIIAIIKNNVIFNIVLNKLSLQSPYFSSELISGVTLGLVEITNGCYNISASPLSDIFKLSLISFLCSFSGLSITAQVHSFTYKYKELSMKRYIFRKFIQGIISFIITFIICNIYGDAITSATTSPRTFEYTSIYIPIMLFLAISFVLFKIKNLFDIS